MTNRSVFFVSDGTGITAETFGNAILAQFEFEYRHIRLPFIDTIEKAHLAVEQINSCFENEGRKPIVFTTLANEKVLEVVNQECKGMILDGRFSDASKSKAYQNRIEAINFSLAHDDGQTQVDLDKSDVILVGVSRSGKTPTSLYLAMQHGLKASNYPLIPEDFERQLFPPALLPHLPKIFGLTIHPDRLSEIRNERRPHSRYASLDNCKMEVREAESMMRRYGVRWLSTTTKSIEEIATTILQEIKPERLIY